MFRHFKTVFKLISHKRVGEWVVGGRVRRWVGWPVARRSHHDDEVQIGTNTNTSSSLTLLRTQPGDTVIGWWLLFIQFVVLLPSSQYIIQSTSTSTVFSLYSYSLHLDSQRPPSFTRTCTRKVNNNNNNNDFISIALFHVKHAQLRWKMPMNNTHTRARTRAHHKHLTTNNSI